MIAFKGLLNKEIKITRHWFFMSLALVLGAALIGLGLSNYFNEPVILAVIAIVVFTLHFFYIPVYLLSSLNLESQTMLWLHNPNSAIKLFTAKLSAALLFFLFSCFFAFSIAIWAVGHSGAMPEFTGKIVPSLFFMGSAITLASIYQGIWLLFYWSIFQSMKPVPSLRALRWPIVIGLWLVINVTGNYLRNQPFFKKFTEMGTLNFDSFPVFNFEFDGNTASAGLAKNFELSVTSGLLYTAITITVFLFASWILERKVEV